MQNGTIRRSRARNLNDPQHWQAWLKACQKDEWSSQRLRLPGPFGMLTGSDVRGITAIAHCWPVYVHTSDPEHVIAAVRALLFTVQNKCWGFARELIAQSMDWGDREPVWDRVMDGWIEDTAQRLTVALVGGATLAPRSRIYPFDQNVESQAEIRSRSK